MKKNFIFKLASAILLVLVAVLWLLSALMPEKFGGNNLSWLITVFAGGMAVIFIAMGIFQKELTSIRKFYVFLGALFGVAAVCALIGTFLSETVVLPVVAIVLAAAGLISTLFVQGKKWDAGDNEEPDYKNYYERKAEKEEKEAVAKKAEESENASEEEK